MRRSTVHLPKPLLLERVDQFLQGRQENVPRASPSVGHPLCVYTGELVLSAVEREVDMDTTPGRMLMYRRPSTLRLFAMVFVLAAGLATALGAVLSAAQAAQLGGSSSSVYPRTTANPGTSPQAPMGTSGSLRATNSLLPTPTPRREGHFTTKSEGSRLQA